VQELPRRKADSVSDKANHWWTGNLDPDRFLETSRTPNKKSQDGGFFVVSAQVERMTK